MCFEYQGIIFDGEKMLNFSQMLTVRPGGVDPPYGQPDRKISVIFFDDFPKLNPQNVQASITHHPGEV